MNGVLLAVQTSPRPGGQSYLGPTLRALDTEGAAFHPYRCVFSDGPLLAPCAWPSIVTPQPTGVRFAFWRVLEFAAAAELDLVSLQDDVEPCLNGVAAALRLEVPDDLPFVTMFQSDPIRSTGDGLERELLRGPFRHTQAIKLPLRTVQQLAKAGIPPNPFKNGQHDDWALGKALHLLGWRAYGVVMPSWFEHVGLVSAAHYADHFAEHPRPHPRALRWSVAYDALRWRP